MNDLDPALLTALQRPEAYPHPAAAIEHIETHISHVFLAGDYAYKLKKPVDLGFLDFTSLEKRRAACAEELRLNRRLAPDVYLAVVPVCRGPGGIRVTMDGCGKSEVEIEVAVQMRRLPQEGLLDRLAQRGDLALAHMTDIARQVARFHAAARRGPEIDVYGRIESLRVPVIQNFTQTEPYIGRTVSAALHAQLRASAGRFLDTHAALFNARVEQGRIVDGHGDLHLRNMFLEHGKVIVFDCIEFNPALRAGDAMNDIAFLVMDLLHRGLAAHANRFLNDYLEQTRDYGGLVLLDFYTFYRACVRAKVRSFESDNAMPEARAAIEREAAAYFDLAARLLAPRRGGLLITCGLSGSGKTTVAREAARILDGIVVRSDAVRKHLAAIPLDVRGDTSGKEIYTPQMTQRTYSALLDHGREIIASGRWAILDAVYGRRDERTAAAALARELGVPFGILYCEAPQVELERRLQARAAGGADISDATVEVLAGQLAHFEPPAAEENARPAQSAGTAAGLVTLLSGWPR